MAEPEFPVLWKGDESVRVSRYSRSFRDYLDLGYSEAHTGPDIVSDTEVPSGSSNEEGKEEDPDG